MGSEISTSIALDWRLADATNLLVDSRFRFFGNDQLAGQDYVAQGDQLGIGATLELPLGAHVTRWGMHAAYKTDNELLYLTDEEAAADSIALSVAGGSTFGFEARVGRALSPSVLTYVEAAVDVVSGSDYALPTNGTAFALGPGFGWRINDAFSVGGRLSWLHSSGTDDLDFTGRDLLLTLEYRP